MIDKSTFKVKFLKNEQIIFIKLKNTRSNASYEIFNLDNELKESFDRIINQFNGKIDNNNKQNLKELIISIGNLVQ
jgi:hypothetical protein